MATGVQGNEQVIGYKYRTPLQAEYLSFIIGKLTNPGLTTLPEVSVAGNIATIGQFSCYLHYSDRIGSSVYKEQLIKVVFKNTVTLNLSANTIAIGVQFYYKSPDAASPSVDWYADLDVLAAQDVEAYPGVIIATVVSQNNNYYISTNGAELSDSLVKELGYDPNHWLSVQNPRENPSNFYKNLVFRKHNSTTTIPVLTYTGFAQENTLLDVSTLSKGQTHFLGWPYSGGDIQVLKSVSGNQTEYSQTNKDTVVGRIYIPSNSQVNSFGFSSAASTSPTLIETFDTIQTKDSLLEHGTSNQVVVNRSGTAVWEDIKRDDFTNTTGATELEKLASIDAIKKSTQLNTFYSKPAVERNRIATVGAVLSTLDDKFEAETTDNDAATAASSTSDKFMTERSVYHALPTINNSHDYTSATTIYAPSTSGGDTYNANQVLVPGGENSAPVWSSTPTLTSVTTTSSRSKKRNIEEFSESALDIMNTTKVVTFRYLETEGDDEVHIGFIAEDTNPLMSGPSQNRMRHADCIGLLIKAVQELSARVQELENATK